MVIYKATLPNSKSYIGCTVQTLAGRVRSHKCHAKFNTTKMIFHRAISKYGFENVKWEVLFETTDHSLLLQKEIELISEHKTLTPNGYNVTLGGEGVLGCTNQKGKKRTLEQKLMFRKAHEDMGKNCVLIDPINKTHKIYKTVAELCRDTKLPYKQMCIALNNSGSYFQYKIKHLKDFNELDENLYSKVLSKRNNK